MFHARFGFANNIKVRKNHYIGLSPTRTIVLTLDSFLTCKSLTLWDAQSGTIRDTLFPGITPAWISISANGSRLAVSTNDGQVSIWETVSQQKILTLSVSKINGLALRVGKRITY